MIRRLISVSLLLAVLLSLAPIAPSASRSFRPWTRSRENRDQRSWLTGLESYAALGKWLIGRLATRAKPEPEMIPAPPVSAFVNPAPFFINAPTNLTVTSASDTVISLSWTAPGGFVDHYQVERSPSISGPFLFLANAAGTSFNDSTVSTDHAYLYRVRAVGTGGAVSLPSNMALGTAVSFEFSALLGKQIKAQHFYDVRTAVNAVRAVANRPAATWSPRQTLAGLLVEANDVQEMRNQLGDALAVLDITVPAYDDPTLNTGANGTPIKAIHLEQLQTRSTRGSSNSSGPLDSDTSTARLDPMNTTGGGGENPLSRNFNWNLPLVSLPGRAGLDLGLTLSYNSLVWTKIGTNTMTFDKDNGFPGPGFRLGFPVIQQLYFNAAASKNAYLLIMPDGSHVELRQVNGSEFFEAADSSHLLLNTNTMILRRTDGTQMAYALKGSEYKCTKITDRNGNYISIDYTPSGQLSTITDTLGRVLTFNYTNGLLTDITQQWNQTSTDDTHYWARFEYADKTIDFNFGNMTVIGAADLLPIKTLSKVKLADDSRFDFSYTSWGQVWKIAAFGSDNNPINYRYYNLPQTADPQVPFSDCPRFTTRKDWGKYWNGDTDGTTFSTEEVATSTFIIPESDTWTMPAGYPAPLTRSGMRAQVTTADGLLNKIYYIGSATSSGWHRGLVALVDTFNGGTDPVRRTMTTWTQDNSGASYPDNPRVTERNVYDDANNRARMEITYQQLTLPNSMSCHLPRDVYEYTSDPAIKLRSTRTIYETSSTYLNLRILGLVSETQLYEGDVNGVLRSKVGYTYDGSGSIEDTSVPAVRHDHDNYGLNFIARANISTITRFDVVNAGQSTTSTRKYNTSGSLVSSIDASSHETKITYGDSFSDNTNRDTFAYPKTITNPGNFSSTTKYNFDFGAITSKQTPQPNGTSNAGPQQFFTFDSIGRLQQISNSVNSGYTRYQYPNSLQVDTFVTIQDGLGEARSFNIADGFGRIVATAKDHNPSSSLFSGQKMVYDVTGRVIRTYNPMETAASGHPSQWTPAGADEGAEWKYVQQTYDWKGRPLVTTNQDGTTSTASYSGCGCAGGEVVTLTDEGTIDSGTPKRRQQKIYSDVLGRPKKTEVLNWENGGVYSSVVNTYNARDQVTQSIQYAGPEGSLTHQDTTMTFDGYGRLATRHVPEQAENTSTTWAYNADDSVQSITDARGASTNLGYNSRKLVTSISWAVPSPSPSPIPTPAPVTLAYDAAGNRTSMTDGHGNVSYEYSPLSQLTSETRTLTGVSNPNSVDGKFKLSYEYNLGGQLKKFTDATNMTINYGYDVIGQLNGVTGSDTIVAGVTTYASGFQYRAAGTLKQITMGNQTTTIGYNSRLQPISFDISGNVVHQDYDYYDDGRVKFVHNTTDNKFDRLYKYDQAARLTTMYTGGDARGDFVVVPVLETFEYNQFDDVTDRETLSWSNAFFDSASYSNHRRSDWSYDTDGRVKTIDTRNYTYDAAGQTKTLTGERWTINGYIPTSLNSGFDGDGNRITNTSTSGSTSTTTYFLRSTVFGANVEDLNASGQKIKGYVFTPSGTVLATQNPIQNSAMLRHLSPIGASQYEFFVSPSGSGTVSRREFDPAGALMPLANLQFGHPDRDGDVPSPFAGSDTFGSIGSPAAGCTLDGVYVPCSMAYRALESGAARVCPNNDCSPRRVDIDIRYVGGSTQRITGLVTDPFAIPDGFSRTWTGDAAQAAATAFNLGMANRNFGTAVVWAIIAGNAVENVQTRNPAERARFGAAFNDMLKRLETPACAKALGGLNTVFDRIGQTTFSFGNLGRAVMVQGLGGVEPTGAQTEGTNVTINSYGAFMGVNSKILDFVNKATVHLGKVAASGNPSGTKPVVGGDIALASFILTHEVGHRTGVFGADVIVYSTGWVDPASVNLQMANNDKIYDACGFGK